MWTVIYIAPSARQADHIKDKLTEEGFLVKVKEARGAKQQFEILIPETELDEGQEVLKDVLHSSF
ncbi:glutamate decarboxylase [Alicyclobacillus fodiniaquatilis]|uniref:Glutamate decarboxylase n=1 Tax=Alicyclobacillus fodiniaquatilis TaxID=1661150 RepID=A0ABW4JNF8_9BACL